MQHKNKLVILTVLIAVVVLVWAPRGKRAKDVSSITSLVVAEQAIPVTTAVSRKRTEYVDWGRNPFEWPQREEEADNASDMRLRAIMYSDKGAMAVINDSIVRVGNKINDKTVKCIEHNRVILTDGKKNYILEVQERQEKISNH